MGTHKKHGGRAFKSTNKNDTSAFVFNGMLKAVTAGLLMLTAMLLLFSFILTGVDVPFSLLNPITLAMLAVSCAFSGYIAAKHIRRKGLVVGAVCGLSIFAVLMILSFFFSGGIDLQLFFKLAVSAIGGSIGGILGVNQKAHRKIK